MSDRYAVFGNPIKHSKSPLIHKQFAEQTDQPMSYERILAPVDAIEPTLKTFFQNGGLGCNITVPFKLDVFNFVTDLTGRAQRAGAVNTVHKTPEGDFLGDNTDGVGLLNDLQDNLGCSLVDKRVLILGAGGAVRGVLEPLLGANPSELVVANRTLSKAEALAKLFESRGNISATGFGLLDDVPFDVVINGTSSGLQGEVPPISSGLINAQTLCYDMFYAEQDTPFIRFAKAQGCEHAYDGLGMLVEQAAESFYLWRNCRPHDTQAVLKRLRHGELLEA